MADFPFIRTWYGVRGAEHENLGTQAKGPVLILFSVAYYLCVMQQHYCNMQCLPRLKQARNNSPGCNVLSNTCFLIVALILLLNSRVLDLALYLVTGQLQQIHE